jgi:hypothetical protein
MPMEQPVNITICAYAHGTVAVTAAQPWSEMESFRADDRVLHARYGPGCVVHVDERYTTIAFDDGTVRKFVTTLVCLETCDLPLPPPAPRPARPRGARSKGGTTVPKNHEG